MRMPRVSIAGAMLWVVASAVAVAALRSPSPLWAGMFVVATLGMLTYALIGMIHARGPSRAYWSGFAVAGWMAIAVHYGPWSRDHVTPMLGTTALSDMTYYLLRSGKERADSGANSGPKRITMFTTDAAGNVNSMPLPLVAPPVAETPASTEAAPAPVAPTAAPGIYNYSYSFDLPLSAPWTWWGTHRTKGNGVYPMTPVPMESHYIFISIFTLIVATLGGHAARRFAATQDAPH